MPAYPLDQTANRNVPRGWNGACPATPSSPSGGNGPGHSQPYALQQQHKPEETHWWQHPIAATEQWAHSAYQKSVVALHDLEDDAIRSKHLALAFIHADDYVSPLIESRLGMKVEELKKAFLPGLGITLLFLAATTLGGAAIGGAIGFFGGAGVGAVPGAIAGGEVGLDAGLAILEYLGLGLLLVHIAKEIPHVLEKVRQGSLIAWNAGVAKSSNVESDIQRASHQLADAEADLVIVVLEGVLAWIMKDSAALRTEKLTESLGAFRAGMKDAEVMAARANQLVQALRNKPNEVGAALQKAADEFAAKIRKASRLMEGLADFVQKNIRKIVERTAKKAEKQAPKQIEAGVLGGGGIARLATKGSPTSFEKPRNPNVAEAKSSTPVIQEGAQFSGLGKAVGQYDAMNPGPLPDNLAGTFSGGRYTQVVLDDDTILTRAGTAEQPLGQFFDQQSPSSVIQARIDKAILPQWPGGATSPIDSAISVKIPAGTSVYVGEVASQGGFYVGGTQQIVVVKPWTIEGVEVVNVEPLP